MKKNLVRDSEPDLLTLLKQTPPTNTSFEKTLVEILESGTSLEDFHCWGYFEGLVSTLKFVLSVKNFSASIKDMSIAQPIETPPEISSFQVPKELLRDLKNYLCGAVPDPAKILELLPYWPWALQLYEMMLTRGQENAKGFNKTRWANTRRDLSADDCPLGENTKKVAIAQYRMALAIADEFKDIPRLLASVKKRLGLPKNPRSGWKKIVKEIVGYLSPFFPITVSRRGARNYRYERPGERRGSEPAVSQKTYKVAATILHLAYPHYWPTADTRRAKRFYHT